jgi:hypothetical protein
VKEIPSTLAGILVMIFAVLPGVPGDRLYRAFVGYDWREDQWQRALRLLTFSLFGLAFYVSIAPIMNAPFPAYLSPTLLQGAVSDPASSRALFIAMIGHFLGSSLAGLLSGLSLRVLARARSASAFYSAWDHFVRHCAKNRWIVVGLQNGESYSGYIETADTSVANSERDLVLLEPAMYDETVGEFRSEAYQSLFIPGTFISSIATVYEPALDKRFIPIGESVFPKEITNGVEKR